MDAYYERREELLGAAEAAYRQARRLVYDALPPGVPPRNVTLTSQQRRALMDLEMAEANLEEFCRAPDRGLVYA
jgi:hypothetical protein